VSIDRFNIRVYGLWVNDNREILLCDEHFNDTYITKFPGGGLAFGEGLTDALKREWREELNVDIEILAHFYTTDFLQVSAFNPNSQVISVYYTVKPNTTPDVEFKSKLFDFDALKEGADESSEALAKEEAFRFVPITDLKEDHVTFPIDKQVVKMLKEKM